MTSDPQPQVVEIEPVDLAVIREVVPMDAMAAFYDRSYAALAEAVPRQGRRLVGPAYGVTFSMPTDTIDLAAGFPVDQPVTADGVVSPLTLPGGRAARYSHRGSYDGLGDAYGRLFAWIDGQGLTPGPLMWEVYVTEPSPEADPDSMVTELTVTLA